jgi:UDP-N-acetylmuramate dehydrogenase
VTTLPTFFRDNALARIPNLYVEPYASLAELTTMKTRARADVLAVPQHPRALLDLVRLVREREWPMLILGGGSNTIFASTRFEGIVVLLDPAMFGQIRLVDERTVRVGAGAELKDLMRFARQNHLMGLEFCTMIPGTVGGALAGNAGAGNWGICDFTDRVLCMTRSGRLIELQRGDFRFSYRYSELCEAVVLEADILLEPLNLEVSRTRTKEYVSKKKNQPYDRPSSGCIFKNPKDPSTGKPVSAGKLIDDAGLKGYTLNSVEVSGGHANVLTNKGPATGEDFHAMISLIKDVIGSRFGIDLKVEARIVGGPLGSCVLK